MDDFYHMIHILVVNLRKCCGVHDWVYNMNTSMTWRFGDENILQSLTSCELQGHADNGRTIIVSKAFWREFWPLLLNPAGPQNQRIDFVLFELMFLDRTSGDLT